MTNDPRNKWNRRFHAVPAASSADAAAVLQNNCHLLPASGRALDLACGLGANALFLAEQGLDVQAWDIADVALAQLSRSAQQRQLPICCEHRDLDQQAPAPDSFDVIVVSHFLNRALCPSIARALKPGGLLFYQTFTADKVDDIGPGNPDFLLERGELLTLFAGLELRYYREDAHAGDLNSGERNRALLVAQRAGGLSCI